MQNDTRVRGFVWGLIGGFAGTVVMDLVIVAFFAVVGMPVDLIYSFIGDVAGRFFLRIGVDIPGGSLLGASFHFLLGLALGGLLGLAVSQIKALQATSLAKGILLGVLYIEIASQPILVTAPLIKEMTSSEIVQWYGLSTVMHSIYGMILGGLLSYKRREIALPGYAG
jgi:hypothetical protein